MSELLLELFSEEIPARMQQRASADLLRLVSEGLQKEGLTIGRGEAYATPRRLTICINDVPKKSPDISEERKGPRIDAPQKALDGFMRGAGLTSLDDARVVSDAKKGDYYVAVIEKSGRETTDILANLIPDVMRQFPWPKSMKWGSGNLRWVRPLQSILCLLDKKTVPFDIEGIESGSTTFGHRFMAPNSFKVKAFADYHDKLQDAYVILDPQKRATIIHDQAAKLAKQHKLKLVEDEGLLKETAGLVEWPVVLIGNFDEEFLTVPPEVLITSMKSHQKCFSLKKGAKLSNHFLLVSNLVADDGGKAITEGNERVIRARLSDAKFFWEQDLAVRLDDRLPKLKEITFHEKLGTQAERVERIKTLAAALAPKVGAQGQDAVRAAQLCKADLVTEMVGEFPELQGLMGRYYAQKQGEPAQIAAALEDHYKPQGPSDEVPTEPVSVAVALADKLDTLVGFWAIDEKPTGSKDPYALRRAALGVIRLLLENDIRLPLLSTMPSASSDEQNEDLLAFFADRLKVHLRDKGARHDLIDAVFSLGGQDDLLLIVKRVEALGSFLTTDDGENLLAGTKRAQNILKIEEKKDGVIYKGDVDEKRLTEDDELTLFKIIKDVEKQAQKTIAQEDFEGAMEALANLRAPVDTFFDNVIVNADDEAVRKNRLNLLARIRTATSRVADFSKIEG